jgi:hypothetical protein
MTLYCDTCTNTLDRASILCNATVCSDCECRRLQPRASSEWAIFRAALREAATNGVVHQAAVRPLVRGRIKPERIGGLYRRARAEGLLIEVGHERSDDHVGKNAGRMEPRYELAGAA